MKWSIYTINIDVQRVLSQNGRVNIDLLADGRRLKLGFPKQWAVLDGGARSYQGLRLEVERHGFLIILACCVHRVMGNWISTVFAAGAKRLVNLEKMMVAIQVAPANGIDEGQNTENASGGVPPLPLHSPHLTNEEKEEDEENAQRNNVHSSNLPSHAFAVNAAAAAEKSLMLKWLLRVPEKEEDRDTELKNAYSFAGLAFFGSFGINTQAMIMDKPLRTFASAFLVLVFIFSFALGIFSYQRPAIKELAMVARILAMLLALLIVAFGIAMRF